MKRFASFLSDEQGTESVEWGMIAGLIVGIVVLTVVAIGGWSVEQIEAVRRNLELSAS